MIKDFAVEAGQILFFARSIGDKNPIYWDKEYAANTDVGGIIAPPTFVQSGAQYDPDWPKRPKIGEPWLGSGKKPTGDVDPAVRERYSKGLHAEMHYEYFGQLRPGDVLNVKVRYGEPWEKVSKRGGKLRFEELITEYYNQDNRLVVVSRYISVFPERSNTTDKR